MPGTEAKKDFVVIFRLEEVLKGNYSQNISKVHKKDRTDFGLFPKFLCSNPFSWEDIAS